MPEPYLYLTREQWKQELQQGWHNSTPSIAKRIKKHGFIISAWVNGEEIEGRNGMGPWYLAKRPLFWGGHKYRIKNKDTVYEEETLDSLSVWGRSNNSDGL